MNTGYRDPCEVRALFSRLTGTAVHRAGTGIALLGLLLSSIGGGAANEPAALGSTRPSEPPATSQERPHMLMSVGTQRFAVTLDDNPTARAFVQLLPVTLEMAELNGNEKHGRLPRSLPTDTVRPGTIRTGDVLLYGNDTLVVFYQTFRSSYSYTRIGRVEDSAGLAQALGPGDSRVTFTGP
jgi:hypothetical protein